MTIMTIPKNAALGRPAEAVDHYPVKRKGERRRLLPNWGAINWLEERSEGNCEIYTKTGDHDGLTYTRAYGRVGREYSRPMFQIIEIFGSECWMGGRVVTPCQCDRFEQSWNCELHPEVSWDAERRCWVRPGTSIWYELHPEDRPDGWEARSSQPTAPERQPDGQPVPRILQEAYQRILSELSASGFTASSAPCTCSICRSGGNRLRYPEPPRRTPSHAADSLRYVGTVTGRRITPDLHPLDEHWRQALDALPDGSMTVQLDDSGAAFTPRITMEVNGETVQGVSSFTIEIEGTDGT